MTSLETESLAHRRHRGRGPAGGSEEAPEGTALAPIVADDTNPHTRTRVRYAQRVQYHRRRLLPNVGRSGSDYGRFRRAVDGGWDAGEVLAAAEALPRPLRDMDALAVTLALSRDPHPMYGRAAARLLGRLMLADGAWGLREVRIAAEALRDLPDPALHGSAVQRLHSALAAVGRDDLTARLGRFEAAR